DVVATLRVLHDPAASSSLARLLTGPRWRIGPRDLVALGRRARDLIRKHRAAGNAGPEPAAPEGAVPERAARGNAGPEPAGPGAARADLDAFADAASTFADDQEEPTLGAFLAYLTAAEAEEFGLESGRPSGTNSVTLTTVHAAKGLQWPAVVVPGLSAGAKAR